MAKAKYSFNEKRKEWYTLVWDGTYTDAGQKHRKRVTSKKSSADLEKKVNALKRAVEENEYTDYSSLTLGEYADQWLETAKSTRETNTKKMYQHVIGSCFKEYRDIPMKDITHSHFQQIINSNQNHPRLCQTISMTFKQIIKSAVRDRILPRSAVSDITEDISLPKYKKPQKRPLSAIEKEAIEKADLDPRKRAFVSLLFYCGLRRGEALALRPEDFNWEKKTVSISKAWIDTPDIKPYPKSENGIRIIPLPDAAIDKIKPFVDSETGYIFHGQDTEIMTPAAYRRLWDSILCSLNMAVGYDPQKKKDREEKQITDLTAHVFRHNYCTELCYQIPTISTKMVAQLLGDNEKMVLDVYSHILAEKEAPEDALNNIFS